MPTPSEQFDPYLKWLGIRDPERPPNHYRLLGLELFETDLDVIATAADRQMAHVRRFQHGAHVDLSQQLLNQLAAAKVCLLRTGTKEDYDRTLRESMELARVAAITARTDRTGHAPRTLRMRPSIGYYMAGIALAAAAVFAIVWRGQAPVHEPKRTASSTKPTNRRPPVEPAASPSLPKSDRSTTSDKSDRSDKSDSSDAPVPKSERKDSDEIDAIAPLRPSSGRPRLRPPGEEGRQAPDPRTFAPARRPVDPTMPAIPGDDNANEQEELTFIGLDASGAGESPGTFARLRTAMQSRDLAQAESLLEQLRQESSSYPQREAAERMWLIYYQLRQFWSAVQKGLALMQPGIELTVGDKVVKVVEVKAGQIVFQAGDEQTTMATDVRSMERGLAMTLATVHYLRQGATPQQALAAFLAVDKSGDPELASRIWHELRQRNMATPLPAKPSRAKTSAPK